MFRISSGASSGAAGAIWVVCVEAVARGRTVATSRNLTSCKVGEVVL